MRINSNHSGFNAAKSGIKPNGANKKIEKEKMFESYAQEIKDIVKRDAANGVYMGQEYVACQNKYVSKVAPDRTTAILQVSQKLDTVHQQTGEGLWMLLLEVPYKASIHVGEHMKTAHVYNETGEEIAAYSSYSGWTPIPTKDEEQFWMTANRMYAQMFDKATQELAASAQNSGELESGKPPAALDCLV